MKVAGLANIAVGLNLFFSFFFSFLLSCFRVVVLCMASSQRLIAACLCFVAGAELVMELWGEKHEKKNPLLCWHMWQSDTYWIRPPWWRDCIVALLVIFVFCCCFSVSVPSTPALSVYCYYIITQGCLFAGYWRTDSSRDHSYWWGVETQSHSGYYWSWWKVSNRQLLIFHNMP